MGRVALARKGMNLLANFRDLGGILAIDGWRVRSGRVLRSAAPDYASASEFDMIATLGVRYICDFRSDPERPADPCQWTPARGIDYWLPNAGQAVGDPVVALARPTILADFALSNAAVGHITRAFRDDPRHAPLIAAPEEVWAPLMRADPAAFETLHATLEERYGSLYWFLEVEFGVGRAERQRLRGLLLEDREK